MHRTVHVGKYTVTKTAPPELMRVEVEKTRRAFEIGRDCGLFRVPEVLEYNASEGVAVFARIDRILPFRNVMNTSNRYRPIIEQIGRSLAVIHRELRLPHDMAILLPTEFNMPGTEVFIHGDFNGINVCVAENTPSIVILDWQMTSKHGGRATYGSRYFDVIWFVNYMLWAPTMRYLFCDPVSSIARCFLESYMKEEGGSIDPEMLVRYAKNFFEAKLPYRKQNASIGTRHLLPRCRVLTQRFIDSLSSKVRDGDSPSLEGESLPG